MMQPLSGRPCILISSVGALAAFRSCGLDDHSAAALAEAVAVRAEALPSLRELDLSGNRLGPVTAVSATLAQPAVYTAVSGCPTHWLWCCPPTEPAGSRRSGSWQDRIGRALAVRSHPRNPNSTYHPWVFCMSWCADCEFRGGVTGRGVDRAAGPLRQPAGRRRGGRPERRHRRGLDPRAVGGPAQRALRERMCDTTPVARRPLMPPADALGLARPVAALSQPCRSAGARTVRANGVLNRCAELRVCAGRFDRGGRGRLPGGGASGPPLGCVRGPQEQLWQARQGEGGTTRAHTHRCTSHQPEAQTVAPASMTPQ